MNRFVPVVFAPYGTPLKILMPSTSTPRTLPAVVSATTKVSAANACRAPKAEAAVRRDACFTKSRRERWIVMGAPSGGILPKKTHPWERLFDHLAVTVQVNVRLLESEPSETVAVTV